MARAATPDRIERETVDGIETKALIYHSDPEFASRIEVKRADERWEFGIDGEGTATLLTTTDAPHRLAADLDLPEWLEASLRHLGVERIDNE